MIAEGRVAPRLIVLAQSRPGQFGQRQVDSLRTAAPLARLFALLGSWCEGELRTGQPWPAVTRVYWHQWQSRLGTQLLRMATGRQPSWTHPVTTTDDEHLLARSSERLSPRGGLIAIASRFFGFASSLRDACLARGYSTVWLRPHVEIDIGGAAAALWDCPGYAPADLAELARLRQTMATAPIIALTDFARIEDRGRLLCAGATAFVSKPLMLDDLYWQLDEVTSSHDRMIAKSDVA